MNNKYECTPVKNYVLVADGLEQNEARKVNKSHSKMRKNLQMNGWLEGQKAELDSLIWDTQESLSEIFGSTNRLDTRMNSHKLQIKGDVSQVFSMAA